MRPSDRRITPATVRLAAFGFAPDGLAMDWATEPSNPMLAWTYLVPGRFGLRTGKGDVGQCWPTGDALHLDWQDVWEFARDRCPSDHAVSWLNFPFSEPVPWLRRWRRLCGGSHLVFSGVDYTTSWWRILDMASVARCELEFRPRCVDPETGKVMEVARSAAVWLKTDSISALDRFRTCFRGLGRVVDLRRRP